MIKNLSDSYQTRPDDVEDGDAFAAKVVAVAGYNNDWVLYIGRTDESDEWVREHGDKLGETLGPFSYLMRLRQYRI